MGKDQKENHGPDVSPDKLLSLAIDEKRLIYFRYGNKVRIAEPHDYGIQRGKARLLAYQIAGESTSGKLPDWRWMDLDKISDLRVLEEHFAGSRQVPTGKHHAWDKLFKRVASQVQTIT